MPRLLRYRPDAYTIALFATVALASVLPAQGEAARVVGWVTDVAIALLFFLHGARLSREAVVAGATHWRLHLVILGSTFVLFPVLGLAAGGVLPGMIGEPLYLGMLFVCVLPSTVQSSIAFTSIAGGNVPAAVCAATLSNLIGIFLTPLMVAVLMRLPGTVSLDAVWKIVFQLFVPFMAGQLARGWIGPGVERHRKLVGFTDRGTIILVVYAAFGEAVVEGIWHQLPPAHLALLVVLNAALLAVVLAITTFGSRALGFGRADEIAIVFCGSKKSLASGVPIAKVLFAGPLVGMTVLPLMIFHQIQLMVCAELARRYARGGPKAEALGPAAPQGR
jgi:sodium/bile acid cotransporter 7